MDTPLHLGRYEVEHELGRGQMGTVYLAKDPAIDRPVAIKVLRARPEVGPHEAAEWRARFEREVKITGKVSHPHVVGVLDVGFAYETPFIVMEFVAGTDLGTVLAREGRLPPQRALEICVALAGALDAAHAHGIVHRDLKPANVLLSDEGVVKLTDFGVAHVADSRMTRTGMTFGTPAFMSPEQATASELGPASDQFSLASLMYLMLTGEIPFAGVSSSAVMYRLVNDDPVPAVSLNPNLSEALNRALLKAFSKNPADRFPSCGVFAEALRAAHNVPLEPAARGAEAEAATVVDPQMAATVVDPELSATVADPELAPTVRVPGAEPGSGPSWRTALAIPAVVAVAVLAWVVFGPGGSETGSPGGLGEPQAAASPGGLDVEGTLPEDLAERAVNSVKVLDEVLGVAEGIPRQLLDDARCVAVIPGVIKVGFGFGGRHGKGLVSCRTAGGWSPPSFVSLTGGSFGLQIGAQSTDFVLVFARDSAAERLTENKFTLGGDASVSAGPVGRTAEAATDIKLESEIFSYSRSKGVFAGVSLEGATLRTDEDANREAYGAGVEPADLLSARQHAVTPELARFVRRLEVAGS